MSKRYREDPVTVTSDQRDTGTWPDSGPDAGEHGTGRTGLFDYDAELRPHNELFRAAARVGPRDRVLDIGCGTGQTTREAACAAVNGSVVGVDLSAPMLEQARRLGEDQGLPNITYLRADAQVHRFPSASFDLCISRFGTMFFADPVAAFTNIGRALRPGARLVLLVWQGRDLNEWASAIRRSLTPATAAPAPPTAGPDPFSLADPAVTRDVLTAAGFTHVDFTDVHEPVFYGPDTASAFDNVLRLQGYGDLLDGLGTTAAERARARLRATLAARDTGGGVYFDSRAWIVTARRR
ncbi:class I SAM-dependent methyltransferase [Streptosporangium sp. NPDC002524]|uniref:class I SAM-dependent methyltransferase n=1 Tax=Streptosporangium sp. NPDC002524 TaxID=3154537 RepID=UPI003324936F